MALPPDEPVTLDAGGTRFQALYHGTPKRRQLGAIIVLPGRQSLPSAYEVLDPLRRGLPAHGWSSLAASLPAAGGTGPEVTERIKAGVEFLKGRQENNLVLLGQDSGAGAALAYLLGQPDPAVRALVMIDPTPVRETLGATLSAAQLASLRLPVLELRTDRGVPVTGGEAEAWRIAFHNNPGYRQSILDDPHAEWHDLEDFVVGRVHGWLFRLLKPPSP